MSSSSSHPFRCGICGGQYHHGHTAFRLACNHVFARECIAGVSSCPDCGQSTTARINSSQEGRRRSTAASQPSLYNSWGPEVARAPSNSSSHRWSGSSTSRHELAASTVHPGSSVSNRSGSVHSCHELAASTIHPNSSVNNRSSNTVRPTHELAASTIHPNSSVSNRSSNTVRPPPSSFHRGPSNENRNPNLISRSDRPPPPLYSSETGGWGSSAVGSHRNNSRNVRLSIMNYRSSDGDRQSDVNYGPPTSPRVPPAATRQRRERVGARHDEDGYPYYNYIRNSWEPEEPEWR